MNKFAGSIQDICGGVSIIALLATFLLWVPL